MATDSQLRPFSFTNAVDLRISDVADTDDESIELGLSDSGEADDGMQRIDVRGARWTGLVFTVEAHLDPSKLDEVLAEGAGAVAETRMIVSLRCPLTKHRRPVTLVRSEEKPGVWAGDITVKRRDVRSRLELHPLLYRLTEIPPSGGKQNSKAQHRFALLATGQPVAISIDDVDRLLGGPIKIKWRDFGDGKNPWLHDNRQTMYYFEYDDEEPILWLNSRNKNLRGLLFEKTEDTVDSSLRRLVSAWLAETVWVQLFHAAVSSLESASDETSHVLPEGWRGSVLRKFILHMFPEQEVDAALGTLLEARTSPDQFGALIGKASTVVQNVVGSDKLFSAAIRAAEPTTTNG